jgi:hypothetical protein
LATIVLDAKQAAYEQHMVNGQAALKDKKFAESVKEFQNALKALPDDPAAAAAALKEAQASLALPGERYIPCCLARKFSRA